MIGWHDLRVEIVDGRRRPGDGRERSANPRGAELFLMATTVYSVIGEHRLQPHRLLLLGDDGHYYAFAANAAQPIAVEPTDEWEIDPPANRPPDRPRRRPTPPEPGIE